MYYINKTFFHFQLNQKNVFKESVQERKGSYSSYWNASNNSIKAWEATIASQPNTTIPWNRKTIYAKS